MASVILSGLFLGSLYALIASGLTLIWGTLRMFNFAHGTFMMIGAYVTWTLAVNDAHLPLVLAALVALVATFVVGGILELAIVAPFLRRPDAVLLVMITTLAASLALENGAQALWGPQMAVLPAMVHGAVRVFGVSTPWQNILLIMLAPMVLLATDQYLRHSRFGLAVRAVEQNREGSLLVGVDVRRVYVVTFGIGAALAALAGVVFGAIPFMSPNMGDGPLIKAFVVVVLAGLGNIGGTLASAYVVGLLEAVLTYFAGLYWAPALIFLFMALVLVVRPQGLFGEA